MYKIGQSENAGRLPGATAIANPAEVENHVGLRWSRLNEAAVRKSAAATQARKDRCEVATIRTPDVASA